MLERTDAITNEVLEQITFVLAYPTLIFLRLTAVRMSVLIWHTKRRWIL